VSAEIAHFVPRPSHHRELTDLPAIAFRSPASRMISPWITSTRHLANMSGQMMRSGITSFSWRA
jgi:hypothetical protein